MLLYDPLGGRRALPLRVTSPYRAERAWHVLASVVCCLLLGACKPARTPVGARPETASPAASAATQANGTVLLPSPSESAVQAKAMRTRPAVPTAVASDSKTPTLGQSRPPLTATPTQLQSPSPSPSETRVGAMATNRATAPLARSPSANRTIVPTPSPPIAVSAHWAEVTIDTYAYEQALYSDTQKVGHPYALLRRESVGPPRPRTYRVLRLRNSYLELTFMPEMGGRLYQCRFLPTGQDLFYNNRTIKPTHWGPSDQGWWLAIGGMEFCLPVDEHGYLTAVPWQARLVSRGDGSMTVIMTIVEASRAIEAQVEVTLRPGESGFALRSTLRNSGTQPVQLQYWINAMLSPGGHSVGPALRFVYPAEEVIVHSRGDKSLPAAGATMSWPAFGGRDLGLYANWRNWLGFFAPALRFPFTAVYDEAPQLGIVRVVSPGMARGNKLFGFGSAFDTSVYTDDGSQYVEMWGGLTPTFWDYATLNAGGRVGWEETWYVLSRTGVPVLATASAALHVDRTADGIDLTLSAPRELAGTLYVLRGPREVMRSAFRARPDAPFSTRVAVDWGNAAERVAVVVHDAEGNRIAEYVV